MKVGLSFSRCVRDIYEGKVDIEDVLVIISRTDFDPNIDNQWENIWLGYMDTEWRNIPESDEKRVRSISLDLYDSGRLHQPRKFGARPMRRPEIWLETVLPSIELEKNPVAKAAWDKFQTIAGLTNTTLDKEYS